MRSILKYIAAVLVVALVTVSVPTFAYADDDGGMGAACGEDQQSQPVCATIVWTGEGAAAAEAALAEITVLEFSAVFLFYVASWAFWDAMFSEHWDIPICTNCHEVWQANGGETRIIT